MSVHSPEIANLGLPPIDQVGFVVHDLDAAIARYSPLFGPFHRIDGSVQGCDFRGRIADVELDIAFGRSGALEIELIQWRSGESPHAEFTHQGREGMHHLRFRVEDVDAWIAKARAIGYRPIWYKRFSPEITFAYLERTGDPLLIEFLRMP
ncbi:MAG: VOC family protein [Rhodocyclaceae bacterium]|jgi:catechol 2,3-dioxygenase-like lactoylglutathione lyase family enzyme|nr:VOC family protein [Rhodocyclaceae bacterium]MBK6675615.1 VOC family protein [Rhodocyclaceae bacterium]MBK9311996.1 VOC family protein [Rhodocyclaceae bacterium]MBK9953692.1 VOC family protein [Rhodocyclaceae bacterium]